MKALSIPGPLSAKAKAFLAKNPTYIGTQCGVHYYEHPTFGNEATLVVILPNGKLAQSSFYELPTLDEMNGIF